MTLPGRIAAAPGAIHSADGWDAPAPGVVRTTLANGLRLVVAENHTVPLVWLNWVCLGGYEWDPAELAGLAALTPPLLREGTVHRSASEITAQVDGLGANLIAGADWDAAFLNLELLSCDLAAGAELLVDMACQPQFSETTVAGMRRRQLANIQHRFRHPRALADDAFAWALYGPATYGRSPFGTRETLAAIGAAEVTAFHRARYAPEHSCFVLAGDFDRDEALDLLGSFELPASAPATPRLSPPPAAGGDAATGILVVDTPQAAQTELRVGHAAVARDCEDLPRLEVLNAILGRGPSSRLAASLRQDSGLTYDVSSRCVARHHGGHFVVETRVAAGAVQPALLAIRREFERLREELVPAADVDQAKRCLRVAELRRFQSMFGTGVTLGPVALDADPAEHFERRRQAITSLEPESLRELARAHLHPERLIAVMAGPADALNSQIRMSEAGERRPPSFASIS
jgi:zinc protease